MLGGFKKYAVALAAIGLVAMGTAARAANVTFSTTGSFTAQGTDTGTGTTELATMSGDTTLDFTGKPSVTYPLPTLASPNQAILGKFLLSGSLTSETFNIHDTFTLNINQTVPGVNTGTSTASIVGSVTFVPAASGTDVGSLTVTFNTNPVLITAGGKTLAYTIEPFQLNFSANAPGGAQGTLKADIVDTAVPLPATANMGFGLLGGLGCLTGVNVLRRRRMA